MTEETVFARIIRRDLPADIVYEDDLVVAFRDVAPQAPVHVLVCPKKAIPTADDITAQDEAVMGRVMRVAADIAREEGISQDGYRLILNCRSYAGQEVYHLHLHVLGGRPLGRMLARD
ncbi:MAG: HIT domain-containing protein [Gaiellales bacterium]